MTLLVVRVDIAPDPVVQSVTSPTSDPGVASLILAQSHIFVEIDHEKISTLSLYPPQTLFVVGYTVFTLSARPSVRPCVCPSVCASIHNALFP